MFYYKGKTPSSIATFLTESNIPTPAGKKVWQASTIESILTNEKYKGDALLQKTFTMDFLTKKKKINEGEIQQYYIEGSHPAIIPPEFFDLVQIEFTKRKGQKRSTSGVFASMLVCGDCGNYYGSKVWHSNSKYRRTIWQCNHKFKNNEKCSTPHLTEEQLKEAFVNMFNSTVSNREELTEGILDIISEISNTDNIDKKLTILYGELEASAEQIRLWVDENAHRAMNQAEYETEYAKRTEEYKRVNEKIAELEKEKLIKKNKYKEAKTALSILKENNTPIQEFDSGLFFGLIENVVIKSDNLLIFNFKDGSKIEHNLQ